MPNSVPEESGKRWNIDGVSDEEQAEIIAALRKATEIEENVKRRNKEQGKEEKPAPDISALKAQAMGFGGEPPGDEPEEGDEDEEAQEEQSLGYHTLSEFEKLCRLGYVEDTVKIAGNKISLRTLSQGEELEALNRANRYNPAAQSQAFACYVLAQALQAVNGKNWFARMAMTATDDVLDEKFHEILRINPYISNKMILAYRDLEKQVNEKASYAGKE